MAEKDSFFSLDGQERTRALQNAESNLYEMLRYYLGPTGIPDRLVAANQMLNPVAMAERAGNASQEMLAPGRTAGQRASSGLEMLLEMAGMVPGAALAKAASAPLKAARIIDDVPAAPTAVVRPDDLFRGKGFSNSVPEGTFAVRVTGESQLDDMIRSGLVRPPEGGYKGAGTVYFHGMENNMPTSVFHTPKVGDPQKNYSIVADAELARSKGQPLTLNDLRHIWTVRDGEMVDILGEVLRKNRDYMTPEDVISIPSRADPVKKFASGGPVRGSSLDVNIFAHPRG